jgi:hypothetical protein
MKIKNDDSIVNDIKKFGKFLLYDKPFFLFSIILSVLISYGRSESILYLMANPYFHIPILLIIIEVGYFSADRTITHLMKDDDYSLPLWLIIITPLFIWMTISIEVVLFELDVFHTLVEAANQQDLHQKLDDRFTQAQILSYYSVASTAVFFYGNKIWKWIRKNETLVDENEKVYLNI